MPMMIPCLRRSGDRTYQFFHLIAGCAIVVVGKESRTQNRIQEFRGSHLCCVSVGKRAGKVRTLTFQETEQECRSEKEEGVRCLNIISKVVVAAATLYYYSRESTCSSSSY